MLGLEGVRLGLGGLLKDSLGSADGLVLGEPPAGLGAEGSGGSAREGAGVGKWAQGKVHLPQKAQVLSTTRCWGGAQNLGAGQTGASEELPQGTSLAAAGPGVVVQPQELDGGDVTHGLTGQLCQGVVEEEEHGQPAQVTESTTIDLTDPVVVQQQTVEVDQAMEHVLGQSADTVAVQEELAEVDQVSEEIVLDEVELVLLQVEEIQAVELVEDVMGKGGQPAAVHVEALELLQAAESSTLKALQVRVVTQIELLQITHLAECTTLNPGNVVGEEPQNLVCDELIDRKERKR